MTSSFVILPILNTVYDFTSCYSCINLISTVFSSMFTSGRLSISKTSSAETSYKVLERLNKDSLSGWFSDCKAWARFLCRGEFSYVRTWKQVLIYVNARTYITYIHPWLLLIEFSDSTVKKQPPLIENFLFLYFLDFYWWRFCKTIIEENTLG